MSKQYSYVEDISPKSNFLQLNYYITPSTYVPNETTALTLSYEIQNPFSTPFKAFITIVDSLVETPYNYGLLKLGPNEAKRIDIDYTLTSADFNQDRLIGNVFVAKSSKRAMYGRRISNIASSSTERAPSGFKSDTGEYVLNFSLDITPNPYRLSNPTTLTLRANITNTLETAVSYPLVFVASLGVVGSTTFDLGTFNFDPLETKTVSQSYTLAAEEELFDLLIVSGFLTLPAVNGSAQLYGTRLSSLSSQSAAKTPPSMAISPVFINDLHQSPGSTGSGRPNYVEIGASNSANPGALTSGYIVNPISDKVNLQVSYSASGFSSSFLSVFQLIYWNQWPTTYNISTGMTGSSIEDFIQNVTVYNQKGDSMGPMQNSGSTGTSFGLPANVPYIQTTNQSTKYMTFQFYLADTSGNQIVGLLPTNSNWNYPGGTGTSEYLYSEPWEMVGLAFQPASGDSFSTASGTVSTTIQIYQYTVKMTAPDPGIFSIFSTFNNQLIGTGQNASAKNTASISILGGLDHSGRYTYLFTGPVHTYPIQPPNWNINTWVNPPDVIQF